MNLSDNSLPRRGVISLQSIHLSSYIYLIFQ